MGKRNDARGGRDEKRDLTYRPMAFMKGMKVGPKCLACGEPIDVRRGRNGWLHSPCEGTHQLEKPRYVDREGNPKPEAGNLRTMYFYGAAGTDDLFLFAENLVF